MQKSGPGRFVLPLIFLHLAIAVPLALFLSIWADEASTLYTTQNGFFAAFRNAGTSEKQAPLYFWILSLWRLINDSIFFARLFSIVCSAAAIKVFAGLAERWLDPRAALLATSFFALHPILIWASLEIRVYSLVILLSLSLVLLFFEGFWEESSQEPQKTQRGKQVLFLAVAVFALYTNYYLGFLLPGFFAALVISRRWRGARDYVLIMIIAGLVFLPMAVTIRSQLAVRTAGFQQEIYFIEGIRHIWHHAVTFMLPAGFLSDADQSWFSVLRLWAVRALAVAAGVLAIIYARRISSRTIALGVITTSIVIGLLVAYYVLGPTHIALRHASVLFAPLIIFTSSLLADLAVDWTGRCVRIVSLAAGLPILISFSYSLTALHPNLSKRGDWGRIGEFIEQNEMPGQPILIFTTFDALALPYHYKGVNRVLPDEKFFSFDLEAELGTPGSLMSEIEFAISEIPADAAWLWLAVNEKCLTTEACVPLENYVKENYTIEIEKEFYLEKLYLLKKK